MSEKIKNYIDQLDKISVGGIEKDDFNDEFNDVKDILNAIKNNPREGKPTKQQLKEIISFLNTQSLKVIGNRATIYGELRKYQSDFENLLKNYDEEVLGIKEKSESDKTTLKKDMSEWKDPDLVSNIIKKTKTIKTKPQNNFSDLEKKSFEEIININETEKYKVKSGDRLWNIVETKYPNLTKSNKEIIHIINYIVNFNIEKNPSKLKHLKRDDKLAGGVRGSDGIAGDKIRIGDIIELPNIKTKTGLTDEANNTADLEKQKLEEALKLKKSELIEKSNGIIDEIKNKKIKEEIENCKDIACLEKISKKIEIILLEQNVSETSEVANNWKTIGFNKDGENYIIGKDGEPKLITTQELTPEFKKTLEKYQETLVIAENINILLSALTQSGEDVSKEIIKIQTSINTFNPSKIDESNTIIQSTIKDVFKGLNIDNKEDIKLEERISVLKYIRDKLDNYEFVRKNIVEKQFNSLTNISEEELALFIENPNSEQEKIKKILGEEEYKDFVDEIIEKRAEAKKYFNKNKIELQKQFPTIKLEEIEGFVIDSFTSTFAKIEISELFIDKNLTDEKGWLIKDSVYNGKGNDDIDLFADIQGIGDWNISDKNSNFGKEAFILIATEIAAIAAGMLTLGAGAYVVNAMVYGTRFVKYAKLANKSYSSLNMGGKALKAGKFAAMSTIEGGAFYAGYGAVQSGVEGKNMYSKEGLAESIAFMGAFKALNGLYKIAGLKIDPSKPLIEQKIVLGKQLIGDGVTFSALGLGFEGILFEPGEWTAETIVQAFVMAAAFRGAGVAVEKFKFKPKKDGGVEAVKEVKTEGKDGVIEGASSTPVSFYKNNITGETYTKTLDGVYQNSKGEIVYKEGVDIIGGRVIDKEFLSKIQKTKVNPKYKWSTEAPIDKNAKPVENGTKKQEKTKEKANEAIDEPIMDIIQKDLKQLKEGESINYGEFKVTKQNNGEFRLEKGSEKLGDFQNIKDISKNINESLGNFQNKLEIILKKGTKETEARLKNLNLKEIEINGKLFRFKKEGNDFIIQEKSSNGSFKEIKLEKLDEMQANRILTEVIGTKGVFLMSKFINKLSIKDLLTTKEQDGLIKKFGKEKLDKLLDFSKTKAISGKNGLINLMKGEDYGTFGKKTIIGGVIINEYLEYSKNSNEYNEDFISWGHAGNMVLNTLMFKQIGLIRTILLNEGTSVLYDNTLEDNGYYTINKKEDTK